MYPRLIVYADPWCMLKKANLLICENPITDAWREGKHSLSCVPSIATLLRFQSG
jgi:hypothetical protein